MHEINVSNQVTSNTNSLIILHFNAYTYGNIFEQRVQRVINCNSPSLYLFPFVKAYIPCGRLYDRK